MTRSHSSKPEKGNRSLEKGGNMEVKKNSKEERTKIFQQSLINRAKNHETKIENLKYSNATMLSKIENLKSQIAYNESEIKSTEIALNNLQKRISQF